MSEGAQKNTALDTITLCDYPFILDGGVHVNAYADGKRVIITRGMLYFASTDDGLALVIGHEFAHNMMRHIYAKRPI